MTPATPRLPEIITSLRHGEIADNHDLSLLLDTFDHAKAALEMIVWELERAERDEPLGRVQILSVCKAVLKQMEENNG